ncbi:MAG: hypothetical protein ACUVTR_06490 [Dehalococcoidia bacterium]
MIAGWIEAGARVHSVGEAFGALDKAGLITIIVVAVIAIVTFVWIFRETKRRD